MADHIPSVDRMWELMEMAYPDGITVMGWADNMVTVGPPSPRHSFTVYDKPERTHEDAVLIIAITVPHPDAMTLEEVVSDTGPSTKGQWP